MSSLQKIVTIDGPSGVGKSTISKRIAVALGYTYLDTGAMYRAVALQIINQGVEESDGAALNQCLKQIDFQLLPAIKEDEDVRVLLEGVDVSKEIRTPEISMVASRVSALPAVRQKLTEMQRGFGERGKIVAEGRDTGTVVFPGAASKFFLDASPDERVNRRALQMESQGKEVDKEELLKMIVERDTNDSQREIAPLKKADDAIYIDTTSMTIDQVTSSILSAVQEVQGEL